MDTIEINGQQRPIFFKHTEFDPESMGYSGTEIVLSTFEGTIIKLTRTFEVVDCDKEDNYVYSHSAWTSETLCTLVELL